MQDSKRLQNKVLSFDPKARNLPVDSINILLCGGVGAGKSSFVSTIDSLFEGRTSRLAPHGTGTGSLTRKLRKYTFTDSGTNQLAHWKVWDSMGWGMNDYKQGELGYILDGNLPDGCDLDHPISARTPGFKAQPSIADRVHCVCLVVSCDSATDESYMRRLCEMHEFARARGEQVKLCGVNLHVHSAFSRLIVIQLQACWSELQLTVLQTMNSCSVDVSILWFATHEPTVSSEVHL